jgi:hypothetical protein
MGDVTLQGMGASCWGSQVKEPLRLYPWLAQQAHAAGAPAPRSGSLISYRRVSRPQLMRDSFC